MLQDLPKKTKARVIESEDEYVVNEDDAREQEKEDMENEKDSSEEGNQNEPEDEEEEEEESRPLVVPRVKVLPIVEPPESEEETSKDTSVENKESADEKREEPAEAVDEIEPPALQPAEKEKSPDLVEEPPVLEPMEQAPQTVAPFTNSEPNPIEEINKNIEEMSEKEMQQMMEEEAYANKQLQLVALQIEKEKKRKEREANLELLVRQGTKTPKKRGRKAKADFLETIPSVSDLYMNDYQNNAELSEPPGVSLPMFGDMTGMGDGGEDSPKKRRGRGTCKNIFILNSFYFMLLCL